MWVFRKPVATKKQHEGEARPRLSPGLPMQDPQCRQPGGGQVGVVERAVNITVACRAAVLSWTKTKSGGEMQTPGSERLRGAVIRAGGTLVWASGARLRLASRHPCPGDSKPRQE